MASLAACSPGATAATVAWWRFEVPKGSFLDTLVTEVNSPLLDSTLGLNGVYLTNDVPGPFVSEGRDGARHDNSQSLLENSSDPNVVSGPGSTEFLNGVFVNNRGSWTWEAFVRLRPSVGTVPYGMLFGNGDNRGHGIQFDMGADGSRPRFLSNGALVIQGPALEHERWYHLAFVAKRHEAGDWDVELFIDRQSAGTVTGIQFDTLDAPYGIASPMNPFDSHIDEIRISDTALTPDEMLHAIAE